MIRLEKVDYQQWEFITAYPARPNVTVEETMNVMKGLGLEGWEICGVMPNENGVIIFLKRPLKENVPIKVMYADPSDEMAA